MSSVQRGARKFWSRRRVSGSEIAGIVLVDDLLAGKRRTRAVRLAAIAGLWCIGATILPCCPAKTGKHATPSATAKTCKFRGRLTRTPLNPIFPCSPNPLFLRFQSPISITDRAKRGSRGLLEVKPLTENIGLPVTDTRRRGSSFQPSPLGPAAVAFGAPGVRTTADGS